MTSSAQTTITATWDWQNNSPSGIRNTPEVNGSTAWIASDQSGISMFADATASGAVVRSNVDWAHVQFNAKTKLRIPVVSTSDVVTVKAHSSSYNGIIIGNEEFDNTNTIRSHTATVADVTQGYVVVESKGGYLLSVQVELAYKPLENATTIIAWDWEHDSSIRDFTTAQHGIGTQETSIIVTVDAVNYTLVADCTTSGKFGPNGANPQCTSGTKLRVPVTATTDIIRVKFHPSGFAEGTIGGTPYSTTSFEYKANSTDVTNGYVEIVSGGSYIYSVILEKLNFTTATIGSTGWATFSNASATDFTNLAGVVGAYQVTGNTGSAINKAAVTTAAANTGLLLNAAAGTYAVPLATTGTDLSGTNKLVAGTGAAVNYNDGAGFNYVLAADGANAVFQHIVSGTNGSVVVPEGKAYLALNADPGARTLSFDDETTAISEMKIMRNVDNETFYDMQGRRVAQPAKGLYIVNGRKVIVK